MGRGCLGQGKREWCTSEVSVEVMEPSNLAFEFVPHRFVQRLSLGGRLDQALVGFRDSLKFFLKLKETAWKWNLWHSHPWLGYTDSWTFPVWRLYLHCSLSAPQVWLANPAVDFTPPPHPGVLTCPFIWHITLCFSSWLWFCNVVFISAIVGLWFFLLLLSALWWMRLRDFCKVPDGGDWVWKTESCSGWQYYA